MWARTTFYRVDESALVLVKRGFEVACSGLTDREVAAETGLSLYVVRGMLTNPIYVGRLIDGSESQLGPVIEMDLWDDVQRQGDRRHTRQPGRVVRRKYALKITCVHCGGALYGDTGRYRHPAPVCAEFIARMPVMSVAVRGRHTSTCGNSYPQGWFEGLVGLMLGKAGAVDQATMGAVLARYDDGEMLTDHVELARIAREREEATRDLTKDRDVKRWQARMDLLDAAEKRATRPPNPGKLGRDEVRAYLTDLPRLWAESDGDARQQLALSLFASFKASGFTEISYTWTADAIRRGLGDAVPARLTVGVDELSLVGARGVKPP